MSFYATPTDFYNPVNFKSEQIPEIAVVGIRKITDCKKSLEKLFLDLFSDDEEIFVRATFALAQKSSRDIAHIMKILKALQFAPNIPLSRQFGDRCTLIYSILINIFLPRGYIAEAALVLENASTTNYSHIIEQSFCEWMFCLTLNAPEMEQYWKVLLRTKIGKHVNTSYSQKTKTMRGRLYLREFSPQVEAKIFSDKMYTGNIVKGSDERAATVAFENFYFGAKDEIEKHFSCKYTAATIFEYLGCASSFAYIFDNSLQFIVTPTIFASNAWKMCQKLVPTICDAMLFMYHPQGNAREQVRKDRDRKLRIDRESVMKIVQDVYHVHNVFNFAHLENYESVHDKCGGYICAAYQCSAIVIQCVCCGHYMNAFSGKKCAVMMGKKSTHFVVICNECMYKPGLWFSPDDLTQYNCSIFLAKTRDIEICMCPRTDELQNKYNIFVDGIKKSHAKVCAKFF